MAMAPICGLRYSEMGAEPEGYIDEGRDENRGRLENLLVQAPKIL